MRFASEVLSKPRTTRLFRVLTVLPEALMRQTEKHMQMLKTKRGTAELILGLRFGGGMKALQDMVPTFLSERFAQEVQADFAAAQVEHPDDAAVCSISFRLLVEALGTSSTTQLHYMNCPPYTFVGLLSSVPAEVDECLASLKECWHNLQRLEATTWTDEEPCDHLATLKVKRFEDPQNMISKGKH